MDKASNGRHVMVSPNGFVHVETQEQNDGQEEKGQGRLLMPKSGVLIDSRRLPRDEWVLDRRWLDVDVR